MKTLRYLLEAGLLWLVFSLLSLLPIEKASAVGGFLGRMLGRVMARKNAIARRNIRASLPHLGEDEIDDVITGMWDNVGRFVGETPHLHKIDVYHGDRVHLTADVDLENPAMTPMPAIFFNAHFGNFEVSSLLAIQRGLELTLIYREASNPWSEKIIQHWRNKRGGTWVPKGRDGARALLAAIRDKGAIAILADQKFNEGLPVPFFGHDAMTAPAIAELALKYDVPLVPVRIVRLPGARFHAHVYKPLQIVRTGDREADVYAILLAVNRTFEAWIREYPDHWLWIHRRWPD
jgi:KDO2-lipid IV(A) lauroyltransferase